MTTLIPRIFWALAALLLAVGAPAAAAADGYLIVTVDRHPYTDTDHSGTASATQSYKIELTDAFLAKFKNTPSPDSMGTGFCLHGGYALPSGDFTHFMWWVHKTRDHRWRINMWGSGVETLEGKQYSSRNPSVTQLLVFHQWEDLDMEYRLSYSNGNYHGANVSFSVKYAKAAEIDPDKISTLVIGNESSFPDQPEQLTFSMSGDFDKG